jgi:hypothetical protein
MLNPLLFNVKKKPNEYTDRGSESLFLSERNKLTPIVDASYIEWRYHRNPKNYRIIEYFEDDEKATFMLRERMYNNKRFRIRFPEVELLDYRFTNYNQEFIHNSFKYIDSVFSRKAVWFSTFFNDNTDKGNALKHQFHTKFKNRGGQLIYKRINPAIDNGLFSNFDNWDLQPHVVDST